MNYFVITNGRQSGPHSLAELQSMGLAPDTPVWTEGMPDWSRAGDVAELSILFESRPPKATLYYAIIGGEQTGPMLPAELVGRGVAPTTPVWTEGMPDWKAASAVHDFQPFFSTSPFHGGAPEYRRYSPGSNPADFHQTAPRAIPHTNWLPWAIVGTILAACTSCVGMVFGIIGIVKANEANRQYALGNEELGRLANSNAQIMTIIALVLDALGMIVSGYLVGTGASITSFLY